MASIGKLGIIMIVTLFLCSCAQEDDISAFVKNVKEEGAQEITPLPELVQYSPYEYKSVNLASPFGEIKYKPQATSFDETKYGPQASPLSSTTARPPQVEVAEVDSQEVELADTNDLIITMQKAHPDATRERQILEGFELSELEFIGVISHKNYVWGLIRDLEGKVHNVQVGDYLGKKSGEIVKITADKILLSEIHKNGAGGWVRGQASLNIVATNIGDK